MKNGSYITIQSWMRDSLNLTGNDLITYAVIYGFSQDGESKFTGSIQYIADWCGSTKRGIYKNVTNLVDRGLIIKNEVKHNGVKYCEYSCAPQFIGGELSSHPSELSSPNNIDNNIDNKKKSLKEKAGLTDSPLDKAICEWLDYKKERKNTYTETGLKKLLKQCFLYAQEYGESAVIELIDLAISSNYQGIPWDKLKRNKPVNQYNLPKLT